MISEGQLTYISMVIEIRDEGVYINQQEYIRNIDIPLLDSNWKENNKWHDWTRQKINFYNKYKTTTQKKIEVMHSARKVPPESSKELFSYRTVNAWNKLTVEIRNSTLVSYDDFHVYMNPQ